MAVIREKLVSVAMDKACSLVNEHIEDDIDKRNEFMKQTILANETLNEAEKTEAIKGIDKNYDINKLVFNKGPTRICENCQNECLATKYCEICIQNYLKENFSNWTSENNVIDNLIQECQKKIYSQRKIAEWIPYNNLRNIECLTKGGCAEIYAAHWIDGYYIEWDDKEKRLNRFGSCKVVLKRLVNFENADESWIEKGKSYLSLSHKWSEITRFYGFTKDPYDGNYMLVACQMDMDLRKYLQQNHNKLTWEERMQIAHDIILALCRIHDEGEVHGNLHPGNVLFLQQDQRFYINDLGFCGPANKPLNSIYGNLPYIAPEVIYGKEPTLISDVYSIGILMWEISSGHPPFINHENDYVLAMKIVNGMRPKIVPGTPLKYKKLMNRCWDANLSERLDIFKLESEMNKITRNDSIPDKILERRRALFKTNYTSSRLSTSKNFSRLSTSKIHRFENFPKPRNATEEEQEDEDEEVHNNPNLHSEKQEHSEEQDELENS